MSRTHLRVVLSLAAFLLVSAHLRGQVATGFPPYGSFGGGTFDTVNNANLNVHFTIPIINKAGRGMPFSYALRYDSSVWQRFGGGWSPQLGYPYNNWGWGGKAEVSTGYIQYGTSQGSCFIFPEMVYYTIYSGGVYIDPQGTAHSFSLIVSPGGNGCSGAPPYSAQGTVTDGSGYTITLWAAPMAQVTTPSGTVISPPVMPDPISGQTTITDPNGNQILGSYSTTTSTFTDTLGDTVLTITDAGSPLTTRTYTYTAPSGSVNMVEKYTPLNIKTNFGCSGITEYSASNVPLVSEIDLPDVETNPNDKYTFTYEPTPGYSGDYTGRLASVTLPTGGTISYIYTGANNGITCADGSTATLQRYTPDTGSKYWQYVHSESGTAWTTDITDPQGNQTAMDFQGIYETERWVNQGASSLLATVNTCYNGASIPCTSTAIYLPISSRTVQVTLPGLSPSQTTTAYNTYGLPMETDEYTFGPSLVRKTLTQYTASFNRPSEIQVEDSSGTLRAQTNYSYDSYGNLTGETRSTSGTSTVSRTFTPGSYGVLTAQTDFNGNPTNYSNFTCNGAFPQKITSGPLAYSLTWDCNGGGVTSVTDTSNGTPATQYKYTDPNFWRVTEVDYPDGGQVKTQYNDVAGDFNIVSNQLVSSGVYHETTQIFDGLGRISKSQDNSAGTEVDTGYNSLGQVYSVSNPYFTSGASPSDGTTYYSYDALGRLADEGKVNAVQYPDLNYASVKPSGNCTTVKDAAGKTRTVCTDGLGRTTSVTEDPSGLNYSTSYSYDALNDLLSVTQGTQTPCTSGGSAVSRSYVYDLLGRLTSACTPESATTTFSYASSGALCSGDPSAVCFRTAPAPNQTNPSVKAVTTYTYDALNRPTSKTYTNDGGVTPATNLYYDESSVTIGNCTNAGLTYPIGRLTHTTTVNSQGTLLTGTVQDYDPMGRTAGYWQATPLNCGSSLWTAFYSYDLAGDVTSWLHPAGFVINQTFNGAQQIGQVTSSLSDSTHPPILAQNITYTPWGAVSSLTNGCAGSGCTNIQETYIYNNRLQMTVAELATGSGNSCRVYNYYPGANPTSCTAPSSGTTGNNGNVMGYFYQDSVNSGLSHTATYSYDGVNRLLTAAATGNSTYSQSFVGYDPYGNLTCSPSGPGCVAFTYNTANNHIAGYTYDAAGNVINDGTNSYQWDAEGHLIAVINGARVAISTNTYNALGQRVRDVTQTNTTDEAYGAGGSLLWRYTGNPNDPNQRAFVPSGGRILAEYYTGGTLFDHPDQLGSITSSTSANCSPCQERLFYPFGELWTGAGNCGMHQTFAQLPDYDPEIDQYNTLYRHYTPSGRWMSPDPLGGDVTNPQSLNRYAYVLNNPTNLTDPSGLQPPGCPQGMPTNECYGGIPGFWAGGIAPGMIEGGAMNEFALLEAGYLSNPADPCSDPLYAEANPECATPPLLGGGVWGGGGLGSTSVPGWPGMPGIPGNAGFPQIGGIPQALICAMFPLTCINTGTETGVPIPIYGFPISVISVTVNGSATSVQTPNPPSQPGQTGKYGDYLTCALGEFINQGFGDEDKALATIGLNIAPFVLAGSRVAAPVVPVAAVIAGVYDVNLALRIRATCKQGVYGQ
jgi:RHS repeat-associated protein